MTQNTFFLSVTLSAAFVQSFQVATAPHVSAPVQEMPTISTPPSQISSLPQLMVTTDSNTSFTPTLPPTLEWALQDNNDDEDEDEGFNTDDCMEDDMELGINIEPIINNPAPNWEMPTYLPMSIVSHPWQQSLNQSRYNRNMSSRDRKRSAVFYSRDQGKWFNRQYRLHRLGYRRHSSF